MILEQDADLDDALLAVTRFMADADTREPAWLPLLAKFVSHASRHDRTRREYLRVRERLLQTIAA